MLVNGPREPNKGRRCSVLSPGPRDGNIRRSNPDKKQKQPAIEMYSDIESYRENPLAFLKTRVQELQYQNLDLQKALTEKVGKEISLELAMEDIYDMFLIGPIFRWLVKRAQKSL